MFSLDKFYNILHSNLIAPLHNHGKSCYFYPFGTYDNKVWLHNKFEIGHRMAKVRNNIANGYNVADKSFIHCYFIDQEPYYDYTLTLMDKAILYVTEKFADDRINIIGNSERSEIKSNYLKSNNMHDWYYFYHGFAALDWYRDYQYVKPKSFDRFNKVFICYNHLISKYRSYRLHLVSNLIDKDLVKHGSVSLQLADDHGTWRDTIEDPACPLSPAAKVKVYKTLRNVDAPLIADTTDLDGTLSATLHIDHLTDALFHVVTETVYFLPKQHLTEKIFKPIVSKRPFILVGAVGNLAYLKSYGFKTFDQWIDESYDLEEDHFLRIEKITHEIEKLCNLSKQELEQMYIEMQEILEFNHAHFYGEFKKIIVHELVDNFEKILVQFNNGRQPNNHSKYHTRYEFEEGYLDQVKQLLLK